MCGGCWGSAGYAVSRSAGRRCRRGRFIQRLFFAAGGWGPGPGAEGLGPGPWAEGLGTEPAAAGLGPGQGPMAWDQGRGLARDSCS